MLLGGGEVKLSWGVGGLNYSILLMYDDAYGYMEEVEEIARLSQEQSRRRESRRKEGRGWQVSLYVQRAYIVQYSEREW
jgi:hypothetical protein